MMNRQIPVITGVRLREKCKNEIDLRIPGFYESEKPGTVVQYSCSKRRSDEWFGSTVKALADKIGKGYCPVFRFSDGECVFAMGYRPPRRPKEKAWLPYYIKQTLSVYFKYRQHRTFWSGRPGYGYEQYTEEEWKSVRSGFASLLREISVDGFLACNLCKHAETSLLDEYLPDVFDWFDDNNILLDDSNYIPFYFIYAMFLGPEKYRFLRGRRVLVITHLDDAKRESLSQYFKANSVADIEFVSISRSKAMLDVIDIDAIRHRPDIILIGAGVGAANILRQVKPLGALSVDVGYVLDCYADPSLASTRCFTRPDVP